MKGIVDLNADLGESFGVYTLGLDAEVLKHVTSANVACGYHAGDPLHMQKTVKMALDQGTAIGAHPGYPDLMGFGRRPMQISQDEAKAYMLYQLGALAAFAKAQGTSVQHVKLHGAFYNTVSQDEVLAKGVVEGLKAYDKEVILLALSGSKLATLAEKEGLRVAHEVFADRAYQADGSLVSRKLPGAVITDKQVAIERIKRMVLEGTVETIDGQELALQADSICVHGDNPEAVAFVKFIKEQLTAEGIAVKPLKEFI